MKSSILFATVISLWTLTSFAQKKNVCTITINSSDEADAFKKHLPRQNFNFIELTSSTDANWLANACEKKIECDILIVSGHFGGTFFGKPNLMLTMDTIELNSCNSKCNGIFKYPKEVFLFGCNTLAGKEKDFRSPAEYRNVLLRDGFSQEQAEQIAAFRYSPIGSSFSDRMLTSFSGVKQVFGFNSISPAGNTARPMLEKYLKATASHYSENLGNHTLLPYFKNTTLVESTGRVSRTETTPACYFNNKNITTEDKLVTIDSLFRSDNTQYLFENIHYIETFINNISRDELTDLQKNILYQISYSIHGKEAIMATLKKPINGMLIAQAKVLNLLRKLNLVYEDEYVDAINQLFNFNSNLAGNLNNEYVQQICSSQIKFNLQMNQIPESSWDSSNTKALVRLLKCIKPQDSKIYLKVLSVLSERDDYEVIDAIYNFLYVQAPKDTAFALNLATHLQNYKTKYHREVYISLLNLLLSQEPAVQMTLVNALEDKSVSSYNNSTVVQTIIESNPNSVEVIEKIKAVLANKDLQTLSTESRAALEKFVSNR